MEIFNSFENKRVIACRQEKNSQARKKLKAHDQWIKSQIKIRMKWWVKYQLIMQNLIIFLLKISF